MSRRKLILVIATIMLSLMATGCASNINAADLQKRAMIMHDNSLTHAQKNEKLMALDQSDQPSIFIPICYIIGLYVLFQLGKHVKKVQQERREEQIRQHKREEKIAAYKAAMVAGGMNPAVLKPREDAEAPPPTPEIIVPRYEAPATQASVNAINPSERGVSFFSSRPFPRASLVEVRITIGDRIQPVWVNPDEADAVAAGRIPLIRAFTFRGKTLPWFDWNGYYPYDHYMSAVTHDWSWPGSSLKASWLGVDRIDPDLPGYNGSGPVETLNWERLTRPPRKYGDKRLLVKCKNERKFYELKPRKRLRAIRSLERGRHIGAFSLNRKPMKLHKRLKKNTLNKRLAYLEF